MYGNAEGHFYPGTPLPTVVHYCQSFISSEFGFEKRAVPHDLFSCESPMLMDPPEDLAKKTYMVKKKNMKKKEDSFDRVCFYFYCFNIIIFHSNVENKDDCSYGEEKCIHAMHYLPCY